MAKKKLKKEKVTWTEENIAKLPVNLILVLDLFMRAKKNLLSSDEIKRGLKLEKAGQKLGGIMGAFAKIATKGKPPLVSPILRIGRNYRWLLNQEFLPKIKKAVEKLRPFLK